MHGFCVAVTVRTIAEWKMGTGHILIASGGMDVEGKQRLIVHTACRREEKPPIHGGKRRKNAAYGGRLLRNTAISCGILVSVMAMSMLGTPWSETALETARTAMTMRVDVTGALAKTAFVREIFPETALVFWNLGEEDLYLRPVTGEVVHAWSEAEPYLEFDAVAGEVVYAAAGGSVQSVQQGADGKIILCLSHGDGYESRYAYLSETALAEGDSVYSGDVLGTAAGGFVYFELRKDSQRVDPGDLRLGMMY